MNAIRFLAINIYSILIMIDLLYNKSFYIHLHWNNDICKLDEFIILRIAILNDYISLIYVILSESIEDHDEWIEILEMIMEIYAYIVNLLLEARADVVMQDKCNLSWLIAHLSDCISR